ncbi:hypothetical protein [Methylovulum miyakonense]|uniref:hypothetical protein n=1 Tax=Methylovulum miyakonense TaxID=645578 RepID=UPI0003A40D1C|nr:hypothetical protein [Methylovulum miyakonense]
MPQYTYFKGPSERKRLLYDRIGNVIQLDELVLGSSFHRYVRRGVYPENWGNDVNVSNVTVEE